MAIYWVDPYIESPSGGIHGTVNGTTRNGTYSYPFMLSDMMTSSSSGVNIVNGINIFANDEIRLKGMALSDFYYMGTSGNTLNGTFSSNMSTSASGVTYSDTILSSEFLSALSSSIYTDPIAIFFDNGLQPHGANLDQQWIMVHGVGYNSYGGNTTVWKSYNYDNWQAWYQANQNRTLQMAFVDPDYYIRPAPFDAGNTAYFLIFAQSNTGSRVTVTDGWTSETTRNGYTLLPLCYTNDGYLYFGSNGVNYSPIYDLPNTHILKYRDNSTNTSRYPELRFASLYDTNEGITLKLGSYQHTHTGAWGYAYFYSNSTSRVYDIDIGIYTHNYVFYYVPGYLTVKVRNELSGRGQYMQGQNYSGGEYRPGNIYSAQQYSGNIFAYNGTSLNEGNVVPLDNSFWYLTSSMFSMGWPFETSHLTNLYRWDDSPIYTSPYVSGSMGPTTAGSYEPAVQSAIARHFTVPAVGAPWYENKNLLTYPGGGDYNIYRYGTGTWISHFGKIVFSSDYRNIDFTSKFKKRKYTSVYYSDSELISFGTNSYDNVPMLAISETTTSINQDKRLLLAYNDVNNNDYFTMQWGSDKGTEYYNYSFPVALPTGWQTAPGTTVRLNFSFGATAGRSYQFVVIAHYTKPTDEINASYNNLSTSFSQSYSNYVSIPKSNIDEDSNSIAVTIAIKSNNSVNTSADKVWITNLSTEVA